MQHFEREKTAKSNTVEVLWNILNMQLVAGGRNYFWWKMVENLNP